MEQVFKFIRDERQAFIQFVDSLSIEELNKIPQGFNNNIIWNFGHIVVTLQVLCYVRSGILADASSIKYASAYAKGTKPTYQVSQEEVEDLKKLALSTIDQLEADYQAGKFENIVPFETSTYGALLNSIEEIILTNVGHDSIHYGYALAQKRTINN